MNEHTTIAKPQHDDPSSHKLRAVARSVKKAGEAIGRTGAKAAGPIAESLKDSLKQEQPATLAKMAIAALAPQIATAALRFALRNPILTIAGVLVVAAIATSGDEAEPAAA